LGKDSTEGNWVDNGLNQVFTSFDKYKERPVVLTESVGLNPQISVKSTQRKSNKQSRFFIDTSIINRSLSNTTVTTKLAGNYNIYFDRKLFRFTDGFLFELDKYGNPTGGKYFQTKNYR
jgi:hypothetical protein